MVRKSIFLTMISFVLVTLISSTALAVGVRPLVVDLRMRPGDSETFELSLTPTDRQEVVNLALYKPTQLKTGGLTYEAGDTSVYPAIGWVELDQTRVVVPPNETTKVTGRVNAPFHAGGSYTVVIMVEPDVGTASTGITFRTRYAVRVNIHVDRPGLRPKAEIVSFELVADENGQALLQAELRNPSPLQYTVSSEVTVRDENRQLVERVSLRTPSAWQGGHESTRVYPGSEVLLIGEVKEPLFPGDYELRLFVQYGEQQIIQTDSRTVKEGEFVSVGRLDLIRVNPSVVNLVMRAGGAGSDVLQFENRSPHAVTVRLGGREVQPEYEHSVFGALEVNLRGDHEFQLGSRRSSRAVVTVRAPRDIEAGGYYGFIDAHVCDLDGEYLETTSVPLNVTVGDAWANEAEILSVHAVQDGADHLISVALRNTSAAHITPSGTVYVKDQGKIIRTLRLALQEGMENILPEKTGLLVATTDSLPSGDYIAEVKIAYGNEEIGAAELPLEIGSDDEEI